MNVLVVVSMWRPNATSPNLPRRIQGLRAVLSAAREFPVKTVRLVLVTNVPIPEVADLAWEQVVRSDPECEPGVKKPLCMTWESIRILRSTAMVAAPDEANPCQGEISVDCSNLGAPFDAFVYLEGDVAVPADTFRFWSLHADRLFDRGYLLLPFRVESGPEGQEILTDAFEFFGITNTTAVLDLATNEYTTSKDAIFLQPFNPYSASFMMTKSQFSAYSAGPMWDYSRAFSFSPWGLGETAASGLIWDPKIGGKNKTVTHLNMQVRHLFPIHGTEGKRRTRVVRLYEGIVEACINGSKPCKALQRASLGRLRTNRRLQVVGKRNLV